MEDTRTMAKKKQRKQEKVATRGKTREAEGDTQEEERNNREAQKEKEARGERRKAEDE